MDLKRCSSPAIRKTRGKGQVEWSKVAKRCKCWVASSGTMQEVDGNVQV